MKRRLHCECCEHSTFLPDPTQGRWHCDCCVLTWALVFLSGRRQVYKTFLLAERAKNRIYNDGYASGDDLLDITSNWDDIKIVVANGLETAKKKALDTP